ncbi:uncharacterized protein BDV17DRAFT_256792 [Aspergillus undulatus]|uniref:uncharacterized protein n=1 Tax=Aspergillus undulatus TaxID=1810928 RepID=UPI003CCCFB72
MYIISTLAMAGTTMPYLFKDLSPRNSELWSTCIHLLQFTHSLRFIVRSLLYISILVMPWLSEKTAPIHRHHQPRRVERAGTALARQGSPERGNRNVAPLHCHYTAHGLMCHRRTDLARTVTAHGHSGTRAPRRYCRGFIDSDYKSHRMRPPLATATLCARTARQSRVSSTLNSSARSEPTCFSSLIPKPNMSTRSITGSPSTWMPIRWPRC